MSHRGRRRLTEGTEQGRVVGSGWRGPAWGGVVGAIPPARELWTMGSAKVGACGCCHRSLTRAATPRLPKSCVVGRRGRGGIRPRHESQRTEEAHGGHGGGRSSVGRKAVRVGAGGRSHRSLTRAATPRLLSAELHQRFSEDCSATGGRAERVAGGAGAGVGLAAADAVRLTPLVNTSGYPETAKRRSSSAFF